MIDYSIAIGVDAMIVTAKVHLNPRGCRRESSLLNDAIPHTDHSVKNRSLSEVEALGANKGQVILRNLTTIDAPSLNRNGTCQITHIRIS